MKCGNAIKFHRKSGGAKRSGGTCGSADPSWKCFSTDRTRISCTQPWTRPRVRLSEERRMKFANATNFYRKSGVA
jgi:hypothetical protein